jgi:hypothetical protein
MGFQIYPLKAGDFFDAQRFDKYFFDSNSWIFFLKSQYYSSDPVGLLYASLFSQIITLNTSAKKVKVKPKIVVTSLLLTEVVNAYMRRIAMKEFCASTNINYDPGKFKEDYRDKPGTDYKKQLKRFINDFNSFKDYTILQDDDFVNMDPYSILEGLHNYNTDFNDFY